MAEFGTILAMSADPDDTKPRLTVDLTQMLAEVPSRLSRVEALVETMRETIGKLETGQEKLRTEVRADIQGLRVELRWVIGIMLAGFGTLIVKALHG